MRYIPQLDGLRAIAVLLVIVSHWLPESHFLNFLPNGMMGVHLFFVLSGYLISGILFKSRDTEHAIKNFYVRRTLRIFPIYYLTLFALLILNKQTGIANSFLYHLTYTSNFYFALRNQWSGMTSHLWSLSVEEQFYLVWPWLMLFVPKKWLLPTIIFFILTGAACTILFTGLAKAVLTPCLFFAFGLGALLSWQQTFSDQKTFGSYLNLCALIALAFFAYALYAKLWPTLAFDVLALWILNWTLHKGQVLNQRPLVFLGKISYGLYLYHNLVPALLTNRIYPYTSNLIIWRLPYSGQLVNLTLLVLIAWLSFRFVETPFLRLKKNFEYRKPRKKTLAVV